MTKLKSKDKPFIRTRREFAKSLAAVAATPLMAKASLAPEAEPLAAGQAPAQANPFAPQAEALTEIVRRRYPDYLTGEQLEAVKRNIERALRGGDTLHKFDLNNGDEPAFAFSADLPGTFANVGNEREVDLEREREGGAREEREREEEERERARERKKKRKPRRN